MQNMKMHWRRQLWGTGARAPPPRLPPPAKNLREQIRKMYKNNAIFTQFLSIFGPFFSHSFPQGVTIVPKMPERSPMR